MCATMVSRSIIHAARQLLLLWLPVHPAATITPGTDFYQWLLILACHYPRQLMTCQTKYSFEIAEPLLRYVQPPVAFCLLALMHL